MEQCTLQEHKLSSKLCWHILVCIHSVFNCFLIEWIFFSFICMFDLIVCIHILDKQKVISILIKLGGKTCTLFDMFCNGFLIHEAFLYIV
uniref:Uncharacterized protein n=1 Tax=Anguilla anguilla TaxID=7936 RepID=A0A0E9WUL6_ANGAN